MDVRTEIGDRSTQEVDARAAERGAIAKKTPATLGCPEKNKRLGSIHPTAWNKYSRKVALGGFYEVVRVRGFKDGRGYRTASPFQVTALTRTTPYLYAVAEIMLGGLLQGQRMSLCPGRSKRILP